MINNLNYPVERFLFNQGIGTDYVSVVASTKRGRKLLSLNKEGLTIPGALTSNPPTGFADTILSASKSTTTYATKNGGIIWLKNEAPCSDCNFSYHLNFRKVVERAGEENFETNMYYRYYGGVIERPEISGSVFADDTMIEIENDLIQQITDDYHGTDLIDKHDRAICEARRAYIITDDNTANASAVILHKPDGTSVTYTTDGSFGNLFEKINAGGVLVAYKLAAQRLLVLSVDKGYLYTLEASTDVTIKKHGIQYQAISDKVRAIPSFDISFGEIELLSIVSIVGNTGKIQMSGMYNGVQFSQLSAAFTSTNHAARAGTINTANSAGYPFYAYGENVTTGNKLVTVVSLGIRTLTATNKESGTNTITYSVNDYGKWAFLTGEDVFRLFSLRPTSSKPQWEHLDQPSLTSEWNKYIINVLTKNQPGAAGAGGGDLVSTERQFIFYVRKDLSDVSAFETLLGIWSNVAVASW